MLRRLRIIISIRDEITTLDSLSSVRNLKYRYSQKGGARMLYLTHMNANKIAENIDRNYVKFAIKKNNGKLRNILAPSVDLKNIQKEILRDLRKKVVLPNYVTCTSGLGTGSNAKFHVNKKIVVNLDIKDFFQSIKYSSVLELFVSLYYDEEYAELLTKLCTYHGKLPVGSPVSPMIANIVCTNFDKKVIEKLKIYKNFNYTRYVDDITLSSDDPRLNNEIPLVKSIMRWYGFKCNDKKVRFLRNSSRQVVTGVVVNKEIGIPREKVREIRARIHNISKVEWSHKKRMEVEAILGYLSYFRSIKPQIADKYIEIMKSKGLI